MLITCEELIPLQDNSSLEYHLTEHFRLSGIYWGMTALYLVDKLDIVDGEAIVQWVGLAYSASAPGMLHLVGPTVLGGSSVASCCGTDLTGDAACRAADMQPALLLGTCCTR